MRDNKLWVLLIAIAILAANAAIADQSPAPICNGVDVPVSLSNGARTAIPVSLLPKILLVGRDSRLVVVSNGNFGIHNQIQTSQSFINPESKLVCSTLNFPNREYEISAPVLFDLRNSSGQGSSIWNFRVLVQDSKVSVWNQASKLQSQGFSLDNLEEVMAYQTSHDQFEIVYKKTIGKSTLYLTILYDAVY